MKQILRVGPNQGKFHGFFVVSDLTVVSKWDFLGVVTKSGPFSGVFCAMSEAG